MRRRGLKAQQLPADVQVVDPVTRKLALLGAIASLIALLHLAVRPPVASAASTQIAMFEDESVFENPVGAIQEMRHLGVGIVRVLVRWDDVAPSPLSHHRPAFNAADPASYPIYKWAILDGIVRAASDDDMSVLFTVTGGAPLWADGPGEPSPQNTNDLFSWRPRVAEFGKFFRAVALRYDGSYRPCVRCAPLPAVHYWELYNEPNFGEDLAPQAINGSQVLYAPTMYRQLVSVSWNALQATGHGADTVMLGGLAARGADARPGPGLPEGLPGNFGETKPLEFIRALYCLDNRYRQYRGAAAAIRGCPKTAAASRRFAGQNPGLFNAQGYAVHPYPLSNDLAVPPNRTDAADPGFTALSQLPNMGRVLDRVMRNYHSSHRLSIWDTEYGYLTNPPLKGGVSPATQAYYMNWAEYLSWRNPRVQSYMQYLLVDPNPSVGVDVYGGFSSGLLFFGGHPKPGYDAWRLPLYLPSSTTHQGGTLQVWGCVRPAHYAFIDTGRPQLAYIQFQAGAGAAWQTVWTLSFGSFNASCYFDVPVQFPSSGNVRIAYYYPPDDSRLEPTILNSYIDPLGPAVSRSVSITVR